MRSTTRHRRAISSAVLLAVSSSLLASPAAGAVVFGQLDDFQGGTPMGWEEGFQSPNPPTNIATGGPAGASDRFLRNQSNGSDDEGGRQIMFNRDQWAGNYNTAGVTRLQGQMRNLGSTNLNMRVAIRGPSGRWFASTNAAAVALPASSGWQSVSFDLTSAALTPVTSGTATLATTLNNVAEFRILSSNAPDFRGDEITATLGVDNLRDLRLPGDANFDGAVTGPDFALLAGNFGKTGQTWRTGDFNFDGTVNGADFALLAGNFGRSIPSAAGLSATGADWAALETFGQGIGAAVPEPTALSLLAFAPLLARRTRRTATVRH